MQSVVAFVVLLVVAFAGAVVLMAVATDRVPPGRGGVVAAVALPVLAGACVLVTGWTIAYLLDLVADFHLGAGAVVTLTVLGVASVVTRIVGWFAQPKLMDVVRRQATLGDFVGARYKSVLATWVLTLAATYGTAYLVFGGTVLREFFEGRLQHGLQILGL